MFQTPSFLLAGLPAVVTLTVQIARDENGKLCTNDKVEATEALRKLEEAGADVVGFNCSRGPDTILPLLEDAKKAGIKVSCPLYSFRFDKVTFLLLLTSWIIGSTPAQILNQINLSSATYKGRIRAMCVLSMTVFSREANALRHLKSCRLKLKR